MASLTFYHFSSTCLINSIKHEHSCKIPYVNHKQTDAKCEGITNMKENIGTNSYFSYSHIHILRRIGFLFFMFLFLIFPFVFCFLFMRTFSDNGLKDGTLQIRSSGIGLLLINLMQRHLDFK